MECTRAEELLHELIDGTLSAGQQTSVEEHCNECADCAVHLAELKQIEKMMSSLTDVEPPVEKMWSALSARIKEEPQAQEEPNQEISWFDTLFKDLTGHWRTWAPTVTIAIVLVGIMPLYFGPWDHVVTPAQHFEYFLEEAAEPVRVDMTANVIDEASSEARWELVEEAFADASLDAMADGDFSNWELTGSLDGTAGSDDR